MTDAELVEIERDALAELQGRHQKGGSAALIERVLEELIAQTRLDEALACNRAIAPALGLDARIAEHRKDLRKAQRRAK